jgi:hypothetical protein
MSSGETPCSFSAIISLALRLQAIVEFLMWALITSASTIASTSFSMSAMPTEYFFVVAPTWSAAAGSTAAPAGGAALIALAAKEVNITNTPPASILAAANLLARGFFILSAFHIVWLWSQRARHR